MIKFFRRIRQNLLSEGKTGKYFKYAIGEVLLVVIGILIALQINNWNEKRKQDGYEAKMLTEIYASLKSDYIRCQNILSIADSRFIANDSIIKLMEIDSINDKTVNRYFTISAGILRIEFQTSAYESLKSKGLDIISNYDLRNALSYFYDSSYQNTLESFSNYNIHIRNEWRPFMINNFQFEMYDDSNGNTRLARHPIDWNKLNSEPKMKNILILNKALIVLQQNNIQQLMKQLQNLLKLIEKYISVDSFNNK
ncbi:MAG: hypothetical protein HKN90_06950 [Flavobacteriaceae bacterium]|nr:hypothetical protein [Flavobacteriaceae bacterium]